jgi:dolichol kinase
VSERKGGRRDLKRIERDLQAAADRVREEAHAAGERVREEAGRMKEEASAAAGRMKGEAQAAASRVVEEAHAAAERVKDEAPRKAIHLSSIVIPLAILHLPLVWVQRTLMIVAVCLLVADLVKIHHEKLRTYFTEFFGRLIRRHEHAEITGSTYMIVSALLATYLFDRGVAAAALVYLIVGDTLAAMVGKAWGRTRIFGNKTLEGFLAGFLASFAAAWALVPGIPPHQLAAAALVAALVEIWPIPVDDNFRIPLLAGLVLEWMR